MSNLRRSIMFTVMSATRASFRCTRPLTVQQAIAIAGGLTPLGTDSRMKIKRKAADGQTEEMPASLDDEVEPNDTIIVNERLF